MTATTIASGRVPTRRKATVDRTLRSLGTDPSTQIARLYAFVEESGTVPDFDLLLRLHRQESGLARALDAVGQLEAMGASMPEDAKDVQRQRAARHA